MRPELCVVFEIADFVDFVFGLDVTVLGNSHVDSDAILVGVFPVDTRVHDRLIGTVGGDAARAGATSCVFASLMSTDVKIAHSSESLAEIANFVLADTANTLQKCLAKVSQFIAIRSGQTDTGNNDPLVIGELLFCCRNHKAELRNALENGPTSATR